MGDELALRNDPSYLTDPAKADDNRWMHRPRMDWAVAERRHTPGTLEARVFSMFVGLAADRASIGALDASGRQEVLRSSSKSVLAFARSHPAHGTFTMLAMRSNE